MPDVDERLDHVEQGLKDLGERIDEQFAEVDRRFDAVTADVQKLRVLGEDNATQIKQIAELQVHHGSVLAEHSVALKRIEEAIEPLKVLPDAVQSVVRDHERRITALEEASRQRTPDA